MILILHLFFIFIVEKPTSTSILEKELEILDLPYVVACVEPGLNDVTLSNHGYHISTYYRGAFQPDSSHFVGWNGGENEKMSSQEILEAILLVQRHCSFRTVRSSLKAQYTPKIMSTLKRRSSHLKLLHCQGLSAAFSSALL